MKNFGTTTSSQKLSNFAFLADVFVIRVLKEKILPWMHYGRQPRKEMNLQNHHHHRHIEF